jgi:AbiV family abortive infection protein
VRAATSGWASIDPRLAAKLAKSCLLNSNSLADSAALLAGRGKWGQAQALQILGVEELLKAFEFRMLADGISGHKGGKARGPFNIPIGALRDHRGKHTLALVTLGAMQLGSKMHDSFRRTYGRDITDTELVDAVRERKLPVTDELGAQLQPGGSEAEKLRNIVELIGALEARKQRGFYVDVTGARIEEPKHVPRSEYEQVRVIFEDFLALCAESILDGIPEIMVKLAQSMGQTSAPFKSGQTHST